MKLSMQTNLFDLKYTEGDKNAPALLEKHCHFRYEIIAVMNGCIKIIIEGQTYRCQKNDVAVIPPLTYHSVSVSNEGEYKRITALFDGSILPAQIADRLAENVQASPIFSSVNLQHLTRSLHNAMEKEDPDSYSLLADAIALQIIYACTEEQERIVGKSNTSDNTVLEKAIKYIDMHIAEKISLEKMSQALFISHSSLSHIFSEKMQIPPKQYIIRKKLAYATMLIESGMPMTEAARAVGYENYSNFYRMYKKTNSTGG